MTVVDLFAGLGGWDHAARHLGLPDPLGVENDGDACASRHLSGLPTDERDIAEIDPAEFGAVDGLIASPPCQSFSIAGKRRGLDDSRGQLVWKPLEWALALRPTWVALEQVPPVLPIWEQTAEALSAVGYKTATFVMSGEQYGLPQTRKRAILLAHRDRQPVVPEPTHRAYNPSRPDEGDDLFGLPKWVSMAEALGWGRHRPSWTLAPGTDAGGADLAMMGGSGIRKTVGAEIDRGEWTFGEQRRANAAIRNANEPSPTLLANAGKSNNWEFRPATTVTTTNRLGAPGHHDANNRQFDPKNGAVKLTIEQSLILQGFDPATPLAGSRTSQFRQVGNAIPPTMARPLLAEVTR